MGESIQNGTLRFVTESPTESRVVFECSAQLETDITFERIQFTLWLPPESHEHAAQLLKENVHHVFIPDDEAEEEDKAN